VGLLVRRTGFGVAVALGIALLLSGGPPAQAGGGEFGVTVNARTVIGGADVSFRLDGLLTTAAGSAPCAGGRVTAGELTIGDTDETHTGVITGGVVTARCVPGLIDGVYGEARGYWESPDTVPFTIRFIAVQAGDGSLSGVVGEVLSANVNPEARPPIFAFSGRWNGTGTSQGLDGAGGAATDSAVLEALLDRRADEEVSEGAEAGEGVPLLRPFSLSLTTTLTLGRGTVTLRARGILQGTGRDCNFGQFTGGVLLLQDDDSTIRGDIGGGFVSDCGGAKRLSFNAAGTARDALASVFSLQGQATRGPRGQLTAVSARLQTEVDQGSPRAVAGPGSVLDDVERLRAHRFLYNGGLEGSGAARGFRNSNAPQPGPRRGRFDLMLAGTDGPTDVAIRVKGLFTRGGRGSATLRPSEATIDVGSKLYQLRLQQPVTLRIDPDGRGRLVLTGTLLDPAEPAPGQPSEPVGFLIAEIPSEPPPRDLFVRGGLVRLAGTVASLTIGADTTHPAVAGRLKTVVGG
jgi:hypothetical protein